MAVKTARVRLDRETHYRLHAVHSELHDIMGIIEDAGDPRWLALHAAMQLVSLAMRLDDELSETDTP